MLYSILMIRRGRFWLIQPSRWLIGLLAVGLVVAFQPNLVLADQTQELLNQQAALRQQLLATQQQAQASREQATQFGSKVRSLQGSIRVVSNQIGTTQDQIVAVTQSITDKQHEIEVTQHELEVQKNNQDEAIRTLYELGDPDPITVVLGSTSIAQIIQQSQYIASIEQSVQLVIDQTKTLKAKLSQDQQDLKDQQSKLNELKGQQERERSGLAAEQSNAAANQAAATASQQQATALAATIQARIAETQRKLSVLTATARWGSDVVSDAPTGWYYNQLNYYDQLGASPYTVHDYGCLITSLAMVATRAGNAVTPPWIASHPNWFDGEGNAYISSIADGIGLVVTSSGSANWNTIDSELDKGHLVIVSIYLPNVGAINADGSSHFIVISGKRGNHYLMQDPLGADRGYAISQVRSMLTLRSY